MSESSRSIVDSTKHPSHVYTPEEQSAVSQALYPPTTLHAAMDLRQFFSGSIVAAGFPLMAGVALYGWRAFILVVGVMLSATLGLVLWKRIGPRGAHIHMSHGVWLSLILGLTLPAHLASADPGWFSPAALWPLVPLAGLLLALVIWLFGGVGARVHPVVIVYLLLVAAAHASLVPHHVLRRDHLVAGDVLDVDPHIPLVATTDPWAIAEMNSSQKGQSLHRTPASEQLSAFTRGQPDPVRSWLSLDGLIRDRMPPLEDLIIAGQPNAVGSASAIAVIMGGLFLLYRGLIDFRVPLITVLSAYVTLLVLPIPLTITQDASSQLHWLALRHPGIGWSLAFTFANYEIMAGPLLLVAFFLATAPGVRPMNRRGQFVYALVLGSLAATLQLYMSVAHGPYLALLGAALLTPLLDRWLRAKPLV